jgi:hypothetical protein
VHGLPSSQFTAVPTHAPATQAPSLKQASSLSQDAPSARGLGAQVPVEGWHWFVTQGPSSAVSQVTTLPAFTRQVPPSQNSVPLHRSPSSKSAQSASTEQPHAASAVPTHCPAVHTSPTVQALPSLHTAVLVGAWPHSPEAPQVSRVQGLPSSQSFAAPLHCPPRQRSPAVQSSASSQAPSRATCTQPPRAGSHAASEHSEPAGHSTSKRSSQVPPAQPAAAVHTSLGAHTTPFGRALQPVKKLQTMSEQRLPPEHTVGAPVQTPAWQPSPLVQALPSEQGAPVGRFATLHWPVAGVHSALLHGCPSGA